MTAKEYLRQLKYLNAEIDTKYQELEQLRASIGIKAYVTDDIGGGRSSNISDPTADMAIKINALERYISRKIDRLINLRTKITKQIDGMDNQTYRTILICRYVLMQPWEDIADTMGYSTQNCYIIHGKALQEFYQKYLRK